MLCMGRDPDTEGLGRDAPSLTKVMGSSPTATQKGIFL